MASAAANFCQNGFSFHRPGKSGDVGVLAVVGLNVMQLNPQKFTCTVFYEIMRESSDFRSSRLGIVISKIICLFCIYHASSIGLSSGLLHTQILFVDVFCLFIIKFY
jgi:hypothetical protein